MNATAVAQKAPGFQKNPDKFLEVNPSPRRVRVKVAGETVVDFHQRLADVRRRPCADLLFSHGGCADGFVLAHRECQSLRL